jgi:iron complex transport system substrate-binding protein
MRICSLLPGATEVIVALGLADQLVGISHECDYPPEIRHLQSVVRPRLDPHSPSGEIDQAVRTATSAGEDLYILDEAALVAAAPDLIVTQQLCDVCAVTPRQLQAVLQRLGTSPQVLSLQPQTLDDICLDIDRIGQAVDRPESARALVERLRGRLAGVRDAVRSREQATVVCLEWLDPPYIAGHWVPEMIALAGGQDLLGKAGAPSRRATWQEVLAADPDVILIAPCGFSLPRAVQEAPLLNQAAPPDAWAARTRQVFAVDAAAYFSRPGPRVVDGVELLAQLLHPGALGISNPAGAERIPLQTFAPSRQQR